MPGEDLRASWERSERHLREALRHQPLPDDVRALVVDFIDHDEFGVAFESITNVLVEGGATLRPEARGALAEAARELGLEGNADWVRLSPISLDFYDAELRAHHEHLRAAYGIREGDAVLDIGCGTGLTTRDAARAAAPGRVVGVDVSERMLERARELTAAEGLDNAEYELGDAQAHRFGSAFDVAISRFGTMFFSDPPAAFANIGAALRPRARLVLLVWQPRKENEWVRAIDAALGDAAQLPAPGSDAFSLGDAEATTRLLEGAGFADIRFEAVHEPVFYGVDVDAALAVVLGFQDTRAALATLSDGEAARTVERLREVLTAHYSDDHGVALDARSWLITARRRDR
jgi:SAM-dependent methyltransferase